MTVAEGAKEMEVKEGLLMVGEYRGHTERKSATNGKTYYGVKILVGDFVHKMDVSPEVLMKIKAEERQTVLAHYFEFNGKFGPNKILKDLMVL